MSIFLNMECTVKLAELENPKLKSLTGKTFAGKIDNISAGGLKLLCGFDFPIKDKIVLEFSFDIYDESFCVKGEIIRKEEYRKSNHTYGYGVQFVDLSQADEIRLTQSLNRVLLEKRVM